MNFEWFARYVAELSRQSLTTMGRRAGVTPYRRQGQWRFRTASGEDRTLEQVFAALQANPRGQQWIREVYEGPLRAAEAHRQSEVSRTQELQDEITTAFNFLPHEFDYSTPFTLPVRIKDRIIVAYRNDQAGRQVEISADPYSYQAHCEVRRLIGGEPGAYGPGSIADFELRMMRRRFGEDEILLQRDPILQRIVQTLRAHADILRGEAWIDRQDVDRKWNRRFTRKFGLPPGDGPGRLDIARERAAFLVAEHGFELVFDSSTLSPHESEMWKKLVYRRGTTTVEIANTDIRVGDEWIVTVNGAVVSGDFADWDKALADALAEVRRRI